MRKEQELMQKYQTVPSSIFLDRELAPLESLSEYLKEQEGLSYHEIALLVGRNDRTIWTCVNRAKKKREQVPSTTAPQVSGPVVQIPINIFKNRTLAPLECMTNYLKEFEGLSFHEIAVLLNRDDRTIWTCHNRSQKKLVPN